VVDGWRRAGREVHSDAGRRPSAPTAYGPFEAVNQIPAGAPCWVTPLLLLLRARVSVSCTDPGLWRATRLFPSAAGAATGGGQAQEGAVRARRRVGQHQYAATVARSITNPDRQAQTLATVAEALAARGETR